MKDAGNPLEFRARIVELCAMMETQKDSPALLDVLGELGMLAYAYGTYLEAAESALKRWTR